MRRQETKRRGDAETSDAEAGSIAAARAGSLSAFAHLVHEYQGRIYNFHLRRCACAADAEDLTQDTFVRAWEKLDRFDPELRFSTWLFTIAARQSATLHRTRQRWLSLRRWLGHPAAPAEDPVETLEVHDDAARLWRVAEAILSPDQRAALWLRSFEGLGIAEIAVILRRSRGATRVMLCRARERLEERFVPGPEPSRRERPAVVASGVAEGIAP